MGLPAGWVTDPALDLTANQQNTALGNGVLPLQALLAVDAVGQGRATLSTGCFTLRDKARWIAPCLP